MPFRIVVHAEPRVIEIVYPPTPTADDVATYVREIQTTIGRQTGPWGCLVDQRELAVMQPELADRVSSLNAYAVKHGMVRSARVVRSAVANLQAARIGRDAGVELRAFSSREEAWKWLASAGSDP
jgi:hypothetical protein